MKRLEAFCDAVANMHHYADPESEAYELRNPGLLQGPDGKRRYSCHRAGYASFVDLIRKHCKEHPDASTAWLLDSLGIKMRLQQQNALDFMSRCASSNEIRLETPLRWFMEENGRS